MTDLDAELRAALRPVEPPDGFTARVMARVAARQQSANQQPQGQRPPSRRAPLRRAAPGWGAPRWRLPLGLAAAVLLSLGVYVRVHLQRQQLAGLEARRQVIEALRLTDQKFDLAFQTVREASGT